MTEPRPWEVVQKEFACDHEETEVRRMTQSNGRTVYSRQCVRCGHNCGFVKKDSVSWIERQRMVDFDEGLRQGWQEQMTGRLQQLRGESCEQWWRDYNRYLESDEWKARRRAVLERDENLCQGCRRRRATQVHHLTYARRGREMLFDLVAVCDTCHDAIHSADDTDSFYAPS